MIEYTQTIEPGERCFFMHNNKVTEGCLESTIVSITKVINVGHNVTFRIPSTHKQEKDRVRAIFKSKQDLINSL